MKDVSLWHVACVLRQMIPGALMDKPVVGAQALMEVVGVLVRVAVQFFRVLLLNVLLLLVVRANITMKT